VFLTAEELELASNRKRASAQLEWAIERGFVPDKRHTDADGRPLVVKALFFPQQQASQKAQPNFGALHGKD
jgi:hypothetical protein